MVEPILIAKNSNTVCNLLPNMANRHGLITGATGTGKTVTLQTMAEQFSRIGVPVFLADVKGDLSGISQPATFGDKILNILASRNIEPPTPQACPTVFWDVFGETGIPVRATVENMGALLLGRMLNLNNTQAGILEIVFKIAADHELELIDLDDLRSMLQYVGDNASKFTTNYGNVNKASIGAIQRGLLQIESQGGNIFFGEPMLKITDLFRVNTQGQGTINVLMAEKLMQSPRLYSTFLLWMLSQLFEILPEIGDPEKPKMVFFFDEAHLLFNDAPPALLERIELVVRLIRSKGIGVYFITQNPTDIPDTVLSQLGNKIQHALRAFTPKDQKAIRATAQTMRPKDGLNIQQAITELAVGEALVSLLNEKAIPSETERAFVMPPASQLGPITDQQRQANINQSDLSMQYMQTTKRSSAKQKLADAMQNTDTEKPAQNNGGLAGYAKEILIGGTGARGGRKDGLVQSVIKSNLRSMLNKIIRQLLTGKK